MTASTPKPDLPRPPRLLFLTVPLLIALVYWALTMLVLPFMGPFLNTLLSDSSRAAGLPDLQLTPEQANETLWVVFGLAALFVLWLYFTYRAVLEGKSWGRVSSIVLAVLSLLNFPFGTVLGILMLVGVFDRDVQAYLNR